MAKRDWSATSPRVARHQRAEIAIGRYRKLASNALPWYGAWLAFIRSCGYSVIATGAIRRQIEGGRGGTAREKVVSVVELSSRETVYRLVGWTAEGGFTMRKPSPEEVRAIRKAQIRSRDVVAKTRKG